MTQDEHESKVVNPKRFSIVYKPSPSSSPPAKCTENDYPLTQARVLQDLDEKEHRLRREDPRTKRAQWSNQLDFFISLVGFGVGIGNVWRFPYLCYKGGGGAFLIAYMVAVVLLGLPIFFLEVSIGQWMSRAGLEAWNIVPLARGIGLTTTVVVAYLSLYYNVIVAWAIRYLVVSFAKVLPWKECGNHWNTPCCVFHDYQNNRTFFQGGQYPYTPAQKMLAMLSATTNITTNCTEFPNPVNEYWDRNVLHISKGIEDIGIIRWDLAICLFVAWVLVYICIFKGIHTSGKVMYFTATLPYVFLFILLIRGSLLPGASKGIIYYLKPNMTRLAEPEVWVDAGTQVFFSYSLALGALIALGSYNNFHHNSAKDCVIFAFINSGTSVLAGFVIFSVLGNMSEVTGIDIEKVAEKGPGLAFIAYPQALLHLPFSPLWSCFFFITLIMLGLDTQFVQVQSLWQSIADHYPQHFAVDKRKKGILLIVVCFIEFLLGLFCVTENGAYFLQLLDYFSGSRIILLVAAIEAITISYIYGIHRYFDNLNVMLKYRFPNFLKIFPAFLTPGYAIAIFALTFNSSKKMKYNKTYEYPTWSIIMGWCIALSSIVLTFIYAFYMLLKTSGTFKERWRRLTFYELLPHQFEAIDESVYDHCLKGHASQLRIAHEEERQSQLLLSETNTNTQSMISMKQYDYDSDEKRSLDSNNSNDPHLNGHENGRDHRRNQKFF
ncbi:hypothetical protein SNEBB_010244 [Seison nebaliae]|nr:hypothetical protein SNEBB_010244 [Seison nebaliae]